MSIDAAVISKVIKVGLAAAALYGFETTPEQARTINEAVIILYGLLSALEAKVKVSR